jgi:ribonuclease HI
LRQYAFRIYKLSSNHPFKEASRAIEAQLYLDRDSDLDSDATVTSEQRLTSKLLEGPLRQLQRIIESLHNVLSPHAEQIIHHSFRPWERKAPYNTTLSQHSKQEEAKRHKAYMESRLGGNLLAIYSDASALKDGTGIGVGLVAYDYAQDAQAVFSQIVNIGENQLVYNGELEGLALAFEYAAKVAAPLQEIRVHADNQAAIYRLHTPSDKPAQTWQLCCIKACKEVNSKGATISIFWVPGHEDITGNERADALAKQAAMLDFPHTEITSLAITGMRINQLSKRQWSRVLISATPAAILRNPGTYLAKFAWKSRMQLIIPMGTKREIDSAFHQLKIGHGYNRAYLHRIDKVDSPNCSCGAKQTPEHLLLSCRWYNSDCLILRQDLDNSPLTLPLLLHTRRRIEATLAFISRTRVGTRKWYLGLDQDLD